MAKDVDKRIPPGLTPAAQNERKRFEKEYRKFLKQRKKIALSILVWGQSPKRDSKAAAKRKAIRDKLIKRGHNAMFSEEISGSPRKKPHLSEVVKEFAQAAVADLVIILPEDSAGALAEAHDFCGNPKLASKTLVLVPVAYAQGYSAQGAIADLENAYGDEAESHYCS